MTLIDHVNDYPALAFRTAVSQKFIMFSPILSRALGSATAAILIQQLCYLSENKSDEDGWFWRTVEMLTEDTSLSRKEQETARAVLVKHGVIEEKRGGVLGKLHFRVSFSTLYTIFERAASENQFARKSLSSSPESDELDRPKVTSLLYRKYNEEDPIRNPSASAPLTHSKQTQGVKIQRETERIHDAYRKHIHTDAKLTEKASAKIAARLKTYSVEDLIRAIECFSKDWWWFENNGRQGMAWFFNSDDRIEKFKNLIPRVKPAAPQPIWGDRDASWDDPNDPGGWASVTAGFKKKAGEE